MTEKRFECDKGSRIIIDNETKLHYIMTLDWECSLITKLLNHFAEENEQLKQRNNRQAKQLDRLYSLVEEKDWRTLSDILDDFKRCEEQLQKEWGTYGDFEWKKEMYE